MCSYAGEIVQSSTFLQDNSSQELIYAIAIVIGESVDCAACSPRMEEWDVGNMLVVNNYSFKVKCFIIGSCMFGQYN